MYHIIERRKYFFGLSLLLLIPGVLALIVWGLKFGIDFTGGSRVTLAFRGEPPVAAAIKAVVEKVKPGEIHVQAQGGGEVAIRFPEVTPEEHETLLNDLRSRFGEIEERSFETIGPTIGVELRNRSAVATVLVLLGIIVYVTWAFRKVSIGPVPSWVYGLATLIALLHDLLMVIGAFAIIGRFTDTVIDSLFITALLTVLGFSVHDTIVVFDRIRERLRISQAATFEQTVNESINQTLVRSLSTSFTTLLVLVVLLLFGGESLKPFVLALTIGITAGTYSSIFVASPLLVVWNNIRRSRT